MLITNIIPIGLHVKHVGFGVNLFEYLTWKQCNVLAPIVTYWCKLHTRKVSLNSVGYEYPQYYLIRK